MYKIVYKLEGSDSYEFYYTVYWDSVVDFLAEIESKMVLADVYYYDGATSGYSPPVLRLR